jgi:hypothetical protein
MKRFCIFVAVFLFMGGLFSANAADMIILKDGNVIEAKIMEIHPTEIRYKRADNLNGQTVILPKDRVLSIKFEGGALEIVSASPPAGQQPAVQAPVTPAPVAPPAVQAPAAQAPVTQTPVAQTSVVPTPGGVLQASLQNILNTVPAITIAGNNLKFQFNSANWTALLNGENFSAGTVEVEDTDGGSILTLRQTHIWPGAVAGKAAGKMGGKLASKVPGGSAVAGAAVDAAGKAVGAVEASGPAMVLEYKAGPPAKLSYLKNAKPAPASTAQPAPQTASASSVQSPSASTSSVQSVPASAPVQAAPAGSLDSRYIVLADAQWVSETYAATTTLKNQITATFNIANEEIDGRVQEVLTLETNLPKGSGYRQGQYSLSNETMIQQLQRSSGVRFKVLGDGEKWKLLVYTNETWNDGCHYEIPIATKKGNVVEVGIPYSKLKQPTWGKKAPFIKSSILGLGIQRHSDMGTGSSTLKVFDFEIY